MSNSNLLFGVLFILGLGLLGGYYVYTLNPGESAVVEGDAPGPYMVITVAGEADGEIVVDLMPEVAPAHVEQISALAAAGAYDGVVFHRVIPGFMAQTGDVEFGRVGGDLEMAGSGKSGRPDLPAEFSEIPFDRGIVGMARSARPDSANSQFFIMFADGHFLNGEYTVFGRVVEGMEIVDAIKKGDRARNGTVPGEPDRMVSVEIRR